MWDFKLKTFLHDIGSHRDAAVVQRKGCDAPGCDGLGEHRAPKSRHELQEYYWFCLEHVRAYNANWDFFKGMSKGEMERHLYSSVWERPTWRMTQAGFHEEQARRKIHEHFKAENVSGDFSFGGEAREKEKAHINVGSLPHPVIEALAAMDLEPPVQWDEVKARYKSLAKKHHPDANKGSAEDEERFKKITLAYTILKLSYENFTKLEER